MRKAPAALTAVHSSPGRTLGDYLQVARRHRLIIVVTLLAGIGAGGVYSTLTPPQFQSHTSVLVQPTGAEDTAIAQGRNKTEINLDTEAQLVTSTEVAGIAASELDDTGEPAALAAQVAVKVPPNTSILDIGFTSDDPQQAHDGATAFAVAYLQHRSDSAYTRLSEQADAAMYELTTLREQREELASELKDPDNSDADLDGLQNDRDALDGEIADLSSRAGELQAAAESVSAGKVVSAADLPTSAISPHVTVNLASGGMAGLLLGLCLAAARQRFAVRVWQVSDLPRRCGVEVLATLPHRTQTRTNDVFGAIGPAGRVFGKLRNEVVAALAPGEKIMVVAGVEPGSASAVVSANLAAALARAGDTTVAVATHPGETVTLTSLLDVPAVPGLSDVFADRVDLPAALHRAARQPMLSVIGPGGCARAGGPTRDTIGEVYQALRHQTGYVVVDAAPMSVSADAQLLAGEADAVILAVECGRDRIHDVAEAVQAVRRINAALLGVVVLPKSAVRSGPPLPVPATEAGSRRRPAPRPPRPRNRTSPQPAPDDRPTETLPVVEESAPPAAANTDDR